MNCQIEHVSSDSDNGMPSGDIQCTDRLDIRTQGSLMGDVITHRLA